MRTNCLFMLSILVLSNIWQEVRVNSKNWNEYVQAISTKEADRYRALRDGKPESAVTDVEKKHACTSSRNWTVGTCNIRRRNAQIRVAKIAATDLRVSSEINLRIRSWKPACTPVAAGYFGPNLRTAETLACPWVVRASFS